MWSSDFRTPPNDPQPLYDAAFDAVLIEQSLATQYGILPAAQAELPYPEWAKLVGGLMDNTPLGRVVAVRGETDRKKLAAMGPWAQRIHQPMAGTPCPPDPGNYAARSPAPPDGQPGSSHGKTVWR